MIGDRGYIVTYHERGYEISKNLISLSPPLNFFICLFRRIFFVQELLKVSYRTIINLALNSKLLCYIFNILIGVVLILQTQFFEDHIVLGEGPSFICQ